jgi:N-acetyl-anhydromuramyl-L-alanine amidase AmpD
MNYKEALEIYEYIRKVLSWKILDYFGCSHEPHDNVIRTRSWKYGKPRGLAFHYTGGHNGLKSMKWFNKGSWGNRVSSCQVLIFDRCPDNAIGEIWKTADPKILELFPVPALILADWRWSTWCTNWINDLCMGIENRNMGPLKNVKKMTLLSDLGKTAIIHNGINYEKFTDDQLKTNVNIGRLIRTYSENLLDRNYCVGHHMITNKKSDPGPAFPLELISNLIFTEDHAEKVCWLTNCDVNIVGHETGEPIYYQEMSSDKRDETAEADEEISTKNLNKYSLCSKLYRLGYNAGPELPDDFNMRMFVKWFQRSVGIKVDGFYGPQTDKALDIRLRELGL